MRYVFILLCISFFYSGCTIERKLYSPTQVNNPSLQEKNDYSISATVSTPSGFDISGGYAITKRLAIIGGAFSYRNNDNQQSYNIFSANRDSSILTYKHKGFHAGAGFYFPLSKKRSSEFIAIFGGFTKGNFEMREKLYELSGSSRTLQFNYYKSELNRWFLQTSINSYHNVVHFSLISRFNYVAYKNVNTNYNNNQQQEINLPPNGYPEGSSFLDFSFDTKIFFSKEQKVGLQIFSVITTRLNKKDFDFYIYPFRMGIGLFLNSPFTKNLPEK
ncbi:MAG: hypothetical protein ABIU11_02030 [Chitinophagaceae bacterium]